ncbi:hypothetical protein HK104_009130 [Borealophlyctis nickersoniae]|nr:hypothetical protein HK104_009130 [Borealophlyctis nickersoniae]
MAVTICGPRGGGKSAQVLGWIDDVYAHVFDAVYILSDTVEFDSSVAELAKRGHENIFISSEVTNEVIQRIVETQKRVIQSGKKHKILIYIDDTGDDAQSKDLGKELAKLYTKARHISCGLIVAIQSITGQLTRKMKNCTTPWVIFKNNADDMKILSKTLQSAHKTEKKTLKYIVDSTSKPYSYAFIDQRGATAHNKYFYCDADGFHYYE